MTMRQMQLVPRLLLCRLCLLGGVIACARGENTPSTDTTVIAAPAETPPAITPSPPATAECGGMQLRGEALGQLRIGTTVASVRANCRVTRDTTVTGAEGMPARIISVEVGGEPVEAETVNDKVWRLAIRSPRYRTADSLGVGTTLERLLQLREPRGMMGEGALYFASPAHCGLSFKLSENRPLPPSGQNWNAAALRRLPASTRVTEVLVVGCSS